MLDITAESGLAELTVDAVAQRARVGKATIYRRWIGKEAMVLAAWQGLVTPLEVPDSGDLRTDLRLLLDRLALARDGRLRRALPHLLAAARVDPGLGAMLADFVAERRAPMRTLLRRAVQRRELRPDVDLGLVHDLVVGPLVYRLLLVGDAPSADELDALIDLVLVAAGSVPGAGDAHPVGRLGTV